MKNTGKRKILRFVICVLCVLIFASVFMVVQIWLNSDGMHFILGYGQIHLSKMCEGIDQDGNKIEPRNVVIDGVLTEDWKSKGFWELDGEVDMVGGLPERVFPSKGAGISELDDGFYSMICMLQNFLINDVRSIYESYNDEKYNKKEYKNCIAFIWIKDGEIVMEFYQGDDDTEGYYIYYSDIKMLDIEQIQDKVNIK